MLSEDQRRRLVANDKALIYFQEKTPFICSFRGNVNSIGIVARPYTIGTITHYRFGCMVRNRVKFEPVIPNEPIGDRKIIKDIIITTAINGIEATDKAPPFVYLFASRWNQGINDLLKQYPKKKGIFM